VGKSLAEIVLDPTLPPQTGAFFHNPLNRDSRKPVLASASGTDIEGEAHDVSTRIDSNADGATSTVTSEQ
jgi:hypothetical protein